jgi:hypothetical protein
VLLVTLVGHRVPLSDVDRAHHSSPGLAHVFLDGSPQKQEADTVDPSVPTPSQARRLGGSIPVRDDERVVQSAYGKLRLGRQVEGKWLQGNADRGYTEQWL